MSNIILVGMPFCGKSSVGKIISEKLKNEFIDTDIVIEEREQLSISKIFELKSEEYFRQEESRLVEELNHKQNLIIATGGGLPIYNNNMDKLNKMGLTFFINIPLAQLQKRSMNSNDRPLLKNSNSNKLEKMFTSRIPIYKSAHVTVNAENMSIEKIAEIILNELEKSEKYK